MASIGYKVPGKKMQSRFGMSHRAIRAHDKSAAIFYQGAPKEIYDSGKHYNVLSKRLAKKCKHERMVDHGHGGPDGGCIDLHCARCGFSHHHVLY